MKRIIVLLALAGCGSSPATPPPARTRPAPQVARLSDDAIIEAMLGRLGAAAKCPASRRVWCIAADGWANGSAADLPDADRVLVGVTIGLERDRDHADLLATEVALSVLVLRTTGGDRFGLITDVPPENPGEQRIVRAAVSSIGKVLKGEADRVELSASLGRHVETFGAQATYPITQAGGSWTMNGKSLARMRKVGRAWVALEVPHDGPEGIFVSIYPE